MSRARAELELVYLLAGCDARRLELRPTARSLLSRTDYDWLARALAERRLLPLIGSRAIEAGPDLVPESFRAMVHTARAATRAHGLAVEAATRRVIGLLAEAGIRALPLKGPLLAQDAHGDVGLRATHDVDVLVAAPELERAARLLQAAGFSAPTGSIGPGGLPPLHFELRHATLPPVELHWRVHWYEHAFSERLLAHATVASDGLPRAEPVDLVASLLLYFARDGFHGVRLASDIAAWWDREGTRLPPRFLEAHAQHYPGIAPALGAAALAVARLTGVPAVDWLGDAAAAIQRRRRLQTAARLAEWRQLGDRDQLKANISLVGGLVSPAGSLREFARRELTLPGEGATAGAAHAAKLSARYLFALWRVRGGRSWAGPPAGV